MKRLLGSILLVALACSTAVVGQSVTRQSPPGSDFVRPGETEPLPPAAAALVNQLRDQAIAAHIAALAAPSFEGRALASRGLEAAAEYIASSLAVAGVEPLGPTSPLRDLSRYFHVVPLHEISQPAGELTVESRHGDATDTRVLLAGIDASFPEVAPQTFTATAVFAGYGIREQDPARDDYRDLDVRDRIVVLRAGLPPGPEWRTPDLTARYGSTSLRQRFAAKLELAASLGARAVLAIEDDEFANRLVSAAAPPATFFLPSDVSDAAVPVIQITPRAGEVLLRQATANGAHPEAAAPRALPGVRVTVRTTGNQRAVASRNILAAIPGSDPRLRAEAVIVGAHFDHLGRRGDAIYAGADDNASGVAAVLELARAVAAVPQKPRRTIVFAFWTGEEEGHLGSEYYVRHPLWPLDLTSVYLNLDMIAHPWLPSELRQLLADTRLERAEQFLADGRPENFIELGVSDSAPDLYPVLGRAARGTGLALHLDRIDGKSGGSDYRAFARRGLPWVRFFGNYFDGYHEPTDTVDKVDPRQVLKVARLAMASAWMLADRTAPPTASIR